MQQQTELSKSLYEQIEEKYNECLIIIENLKKEKAQLT